MQDDTLGVSECWFKSRLMSNFLNIRTQTMGLQFGSEKKNSGISNPNISTYLEDDIWDDQFSQELL